MRLARLSFVLLAVLLALNAAGCAVVSRPSTAESRAALETVPPIEQDYPGWTVDTSSRVAVSDVVMSVSGNQVRQERAGVLLSPSGEIRVLASYARSGSNLDEVGRRPWKTLDKMYRFDGWKKPEAQSLYRQMAADYPRDLLLGAYPIPDWPEQNRYYVGFYRQNGNTWLRGEHVYELDAAKSSWRQVEEDGHSGDFWDSLVPVP